MKYTLPVYIRQPESKTFPNDLSAIISFFMDNDRRIFRNYIFVATIPENPNINPSLEVANPEFLMIGLHKI